MISFVELRGYTLLGDAISSILRGVTFRTSLAARALLVLACALLILARVSGTHLHLCFDGVEPQSSLHLVEDGDADRHFGANSPHEDLDVSLVANVLVKQDSAGVDLLPILLAATIVLGLLRLAAARVLYPRPQAFVLTPVFELRPPPRGPPA